ncbi:MAG: hypothetical protein JOZ43_06785 [Acidobacteriales bacterium]|nr:hypothetical protein [Terriglobales bacterium]
MGRKLAAVIFIVTLALVTIGTIHPTKQPNLSWMPGSEQRLSHSSSSTPEEAMQTFLDRLHARDWGGAYRLLANRNEVNPVVFASDMGGTNQSLREHSTLENAESHITNNNGSTAEANVKLKWTSVVGSFTDERDVKLEKQDEGWRIVWPVTKEAKTPPQVIPVNYLRWDVIYRGATDDWGEQNVEGPHVRIVAMNPVQHGNTLSVLGEMLNEDTVPAFVTVKATLLGKGDKELATEGSFDKMSHTILPKQVTPFRIDFPNMKLDDVENVRMSPNSLLVAASADPVIAVENQKLENGQVLTGSLLNQSGQVVSIPHVLATFYDRSGQIVWVADTYTERALQPQQPSPFSIQVPDDMKGKVSSYRVIVSPYVAGGM